VVLEQRHKLYRERCLERLAAGNGILGDHTDCRRFRDVLAIMQRWCLQ
jgi:hypothetical protein